MHHHFQLAWSTLFLSVSCVDRYLTKTAGAAGHDLELVGLASMHVASKFIEVKPPKVSALVDRIDGYFTPDEVSEMECRLMIALDFRIAGPTVDQFLERLLQAS